MAYNEPWDETSPADTSLASLLGQDIRSFKTDIRQRVASFGGGPLASRPTPESVWAGVNYLATDTYRMYNWNGTTWVDVTNAIRGTQIMFQNPPAGYTGNGGVQTLATHQMPGGFLSAQGAISIKWMGWTSNTTGPGPNTSTQWVLYFGSQPLSIVTPASQFYYPVGQELEIYNNNAQNGQYYFDKAIGSGGSASWGQSVGGLNNLWAVDTTQNVTIQLVAVVTNGSPYIFGGMVIRLLNP